MQQNLTQIAIYYHVIDLMSFSKAAKRLGMSKGYVSKQITQLENCMKTTLLERNTRHIKLTFAGEELYKYSRNIVLEYHHATQRIASLQEKPTGLLRVTAPPAYAAYRLAKQLPQFLNKYPDIQLELILTAEQLNLVKNKVDVAIRQTHTPPVDRIAKLLDHNQFQICASPNYLKKIPKINHPQQLVECACLVYSTEECSQRWPFIIDNQLTYVYVIPRLACNSNDSILQAVLNNCGIARLPSYVIAEELNKKNIQVILNDFAPTMTPVYIIYAQSPKISPAVRVFIEFLQS